MSNLDDRIKASHRRTFPVTPPEGAWERLHHDLRLPAKADRRGIPFGWGFLSGLVAGGLAVFLMLRFTSGEAVVPVPCPVIYDRVAAQQTSLSPATPPDPGVTPKVSTKVPDASLPVGPATDPAPKASVGYAIYPTENGIRPEITPSVDKSGWVPERTFLLPPTGSVEVIQPVPPYASTLPVRLASIRTTFQSPDFAIVYPRQSGSQVRTVPQKKWTFERVSSTEQIRPRWEIGGSFLFLPGRQTYYGYPLSPTPYEPDQQGTSVLLNNQPETRYRGPISGISKKRYTFHYRLAYLEIGHQFSNGIRLSGGFLGLATGTRNYQRLDEEFMDLGSANELNEVVTDSDRSLMGTLSMQYTFFRRRRFRLSTGVSVMRFLYTQDATTSFIYERGETVMGSRSGFTYRDFANMRTSIVPSLQMQYQIGRHLSLTLDGLPGLGLGLRYGIESSGE